jgi:SAM-dependent methyltransferase
MSYYRIAKKASSEIGHHPGLVYLKHLCQTAEKILDVGCGEGTRLNTLLPPGKKGWGVDPLATAINLAKNQYPKHHFRLGVGESLPYPNAGFDLVYSAFVIEHCVNPEKFITEMIRVCRPAGRIIILAPNFGAPNRRSPNSVENPYNKFFEGLLKDFFPHPGLDWRQVTPQSSYSRIDADTTWEPYLYSLHLYLKSQKLIIDKASSLWELEPAQKQLRKIIFRKLGQLEIWPLRYWGPQIFVSAVK